MKKVIHGKVYNTETARELGKHCGGWFEEEILYQKKTGEYFLYQKEKAWRGDKMKIVPLKYEEAEPWAMAYLDTDIYFNNFCEPKDSKDVEQLHLYIGKKTAAKLKIEASRRGMSISSYADCVFRTYFYSDLLLENKNDK